MWRGGIAITRRAWRPHPVVTDGQRPDCSDDATRWLARWTDCDRRRSKATAAAAARCHAVPAAVCLQLASATAAAAAAATAPILLSALRSASCGTRLRVTSFSRSVRPTVANPNPNYHNDMTMI